MRSDMDINMLTQHILDSTKEQQDIPYGEPEVGGYHRTNEDDEIGNTGKRFVSIRSSDNMDGIIYGKLWFYAIDHIPR